MSVAAQSAIRAWINASPLVGDGNPLSRGAYLREQRSPADGSYCVLSRNSEGVGDLVAEDAVFTRARIQALVYAGTEEAAETSAAALRSAFEALQGLPALCGTTGIKIMVAENHIGPLLIPIAPDSGEIYCFQVGADFILVGS
jgi:hypothetical protein